ncbi:MAG: hypothetical protein M0R33_11980 [Methylomonas sp.]|jgi:hypothetical protein|uniref:hypothetical protein n=1 Tax=Methylomonas sp. TaxID=418 RepID=UPI0025DBCADA|nr:hypothetical protein [Methylomonas sp.]MCK9607155.1 hypothetical protein [Methylomonas sp.]
MDYIFQLPLPARPKPIAREINIFAGHRYRIASPEGMSGKLADLELGLQSGLLGSYRLSTAATNLAAVNQSDQPLRAFVWDADLLSPQRRQALQADPYQPRSTENNKLTLIDSSLDTPEVRLIRDQATLTIAPRFELEWRTAAHASQLGIVQLVESSRTLVLADGESITLLDTEAAEAPVLYLNDAADSSPVKPVCTFQAKARQQRFQFSSPVTQSIPGEVDGKAIVSLSVLEKYTMYFMQNADPDDPGHYIWAPVHLPIVLGWSIRVQQRYDGFWDIFRKKLIMPTPSTEAPALPRWQSNSLRCRPRVEI